MATYEILKEKITLDLTHILNLTRATDQLLVRQGVDNIIIVLLRNKGYNLTDVNSSDVHLNKLLFNELLEYWNKLSDEEKVQLLNVSQNTNVDLITVENKGIPQGPKFPGISDHKAKIIVLGRTGTGKTTAVQTMIYKHNFRIPKTVYFLCPTTSIGKRKDYQEACACAYAEQQPQETRDEPDFYSFSESFIGELKKMIDSKGDDEEKLLIIEDSTAFINSHQNIIHQIILTAQNKNIKIIYVNHYASINKKLHDSFQYFVMCNLNQTDFSTITGIKNDNRLDIINTFIPLQDYKKRAVIFDSLNKKIFMIYGEQYQITANGTTESNNDEQMQRV